MLLAGTATRDSTRLVQAPFAPAPPFPLPFPPPRLFFSCGEPPTHPSARLADPSLRPRRLAPRRLLQVSLFMTLALALALALALTRARARARARTHARTHTFSPSLGAETVTPHTHADGTQCMPFARRRHTERGLCTPTVTGPHPAMAPFPRLGMSETGFGESFRCHRQRATRGQNVRPSRRPLRRSRAECRHIICTSPPIARRPGGGGGMGRGRIL